MQDKNAPETVNYLSEENTYTDLKMKPSTILQKKIFEEMRSRMKETSSSRPFKTNKFYYYSRAIEGKEYGLQFRKKDSLTAKEELFFDPNLLAKRIWIFYASRNSDFKRSYHFSIQC